MHPPGIISNMRLIYRGEVCKITSIQTGTRSYTYPFHLSYKGYKYEFIYKNKKVLLHQDYLQNCSSKFITKEENPEYYL